MSERDNPVQLKGAPEPRRILVLSPWGLHGGYSGPLTLLDRLFGALAADGAHVDVIYRDRKSEAVPDWVHDHYPIEGGSTFDRREQLVWGMRVRRLLRRIGRSYDAVHLHGLYLANQIAIAGFRGAGRIVALPVLEGGDLGYPEHASRLDPKQVLLRRTARRVDVALALSETIASDFEALGIASERVVSIGNPTDEKCLAVGRSRIRGTTAHTVGFVGRIGGFKNPELVVRSIGEADRRGKRWSAIFAGPFADRDIEQRIRSEVTTRGLGDRVEFSGYTEDVASALGRMDVFVLPSSREGLPGALVEAMAAGLPCVVTDVGSMGQHVRAARAGRVVEPAATAIVTAVGELLGEDWQTVSRAAHRYAQVHFSPQAIAKTYTAAVFPAAKGSRA